MPSKLPPQNIDAEVAVLGSCLIDSDAYWLIADQLQPADFYKESHQAIFAAFRRVVERGQNIDILTVSGDLEERGLLDEVGGQPFLTSLINGVPTSAHAEHYAKTVAGHATRRRLISAIQDLAIIAHDPNEKNPVAVCQERLAQLQDAGMKDEIICGSDLLSRYLDKYIQRAEAAERNEEIGLSTGFKDLDKLIHGLLPAKYYVVGGRPAMAKTILVHQIAENVAKEGHKVVFASLEMDPEEGLADRSMSRWSGLTQKQLYRGQGVDDIVQLIGENEPWYDNIYFIDSPRLTTSRLRGHCKRIVSQGPLDLIIVDYMQLFRDGEDVGMDDTPRVSFISRQLNSLKKEFKVPVVAISNLNRGVDNRSDKHPHLSDLRQSGQIEYDSDVVMFLYRDEIYNENTPKRNIVEIDIAKHRGGPTGKVELAFIKENVKLVDLLRGPTSVVEAQDDGRSGVPW